MSPPDPSHPIVVLDYGMGNIHSILKALRLYAPENSVVYSKDPAVIRSASALVLPGDGAFAAAMQNVAPLRPLIDELLAAGKPLLGICIGFQILFEDSDEDPAGGLVPGLGLIPGRIRRFRFADAGVRVPHMGWNRLEFAAGAARHGAVFADLAVRDDCWMYFIHSYRAEAAETPAEQVVAWCDYAGDRFPALVRSEGGQILAAQFHPEKSDVLGLHLIEDWVRSLGAQSAK